jgi:hypothetical protein
LDGVNIRKRFLTPFSNPSDLASLNVVRPGHETLEFDRALVLKETVAKHRIPRRNRGGRGLKSFDRLTTQSEVEGPQEYYLYFEDFEPKPDKEFGRKPKFCKSL